MPEQKWIIAITGAPATGKSALASLLRSRCGWPLLTKDGIKETLFETLGAGDRAWSRRLSDASFELLFQFAAEIITDAPVSVLEGNFRVPGHFERLRNLANANGARLMIVELHALPAIIEQRLLQRASDGARHPGHLDRDLAVEIPVAPAVPSASVELRASADISWRHDTSVLDDAALNAIASAVVAALPAGRSVEMHLDH
jgi:predicted kinase